MAIHATWNSNAALDKLTGVFPSVSIHDREE
jgi:hypothetical protein